MCLVIGMEHDQIDDDDRIQEKYITSTHSSTHKVQMISSTILVFVL